MNTVQVFLSHASDMATYPPGRSFVDAAVDAVSRAGMAAVDMRHFPARADRPVDYCRRRVRECEIYILIVALRYGSLAPGESRSYTEIEFAEATSARLPRLVFLWDEQTTLPPGMADTNPSAVNGFRQRLRDTGLVVRTFDSPLRLELEVFHALTTLGPRHRQGACGCRMDALRNELGAATRVLDELKRLLDTTA